MGILCRKKPTSWDVGQVGWMRLTIGAEGRAAAGGAPEGGKVGAPPGAGAAPAAGGSPTSGAAGAPPTLLLLLAGVLPCGEGVCPKVGG